MNISAIKLKTLRKAMRLTQKEFAKLLKCSVNSIPKYESGKTYIPLKIIEFFNKHGLCSEYFFNEDMCVDNETLTKLFVLFNKKH